MGHGRALIRLSLVLAVLLRGVPVLALLGALPGRKAARRLEHWLGTQSRLLARLCGMRIRIRGPLPTRPFILVANHLGYMDVLLIRSCVPVHFIAKKEVGRWPLIGWLAARAGTLFLDRRNKRDLDRTNSQIRALLDSGQAVAFFPEGTSGPGDRVLPFHSGLLELPASRGLPVHAAVLGYTAPAGISASRTICWWGDMTFLNHLYGMLRLPEFEATLRFLETPVVSDDRKWLASRLGGMVSEQFVPVDAPASNDQQESDLL